MRAHRFDTDTERCVTCGLSRVTSFDHRVKCSRRRARRIERRLMRTERREWDRIFGGHDVWMRSARVLAEQWSNPYQRLIAEVDAETAKLLQDMQVPASMLEQRERSGSFAAAQVHAEIQDRHMRRLLP